jgi:AraC family transcriptional regulator
MSMNEQSEHRILMSASYAIEPGAGNRNEHIARAGLHVDLRVQLPGIVDLAASPAHLLKMHAGPPVRGACGLGRRFLYTRGDLDVIPAGSNSVWEIESTSTSLVVRLPPRMLNEVAQEMGIASEQAQLEPRYQFREPRIQHIGWALEAEYRAGLPSGPLYTDSLGMALAVQLLGRPHARPEIRGRGLSRQQLQRVTEYIEAHLRDDLVLGRLARLAGFSASHFSVLFKRAAGLPVHEYVIQRRVERARTLLLRGDLPASQVALETGFAHQSHMARCMRRLLGLTPTAVLREAGNADGVPVG